VDEAADGNGGKIAGAYFLIAKQLSKHKPFSD